MIRLYQFLVTSTVLLMATAQQSQAQQDSLPQFSLTERNGLVFIGWNNPFQEITQLIIQRSSDSLNFFRSIMAMPDPAAVSNGFVDKKPGAAQQYYRIFYVLPGGRYTFTASKKPVPIAPTKTPADLATSSDMIMAGTKLSSADSNLLLNNDMQTLKKIQLVQSLGKKDDKVIGNSTNLNLVVASAQPPVFQPSPFIFSNEEGNLILLLPDAEKKTHHLHVYRDDGTLLFRMRNIREKYLLVDRSNFYQSGWFRFELYDGETLREKNRFFIPPEGK